MLCCWCVVFQRACNELKGYLTVSCYVQTLQTLSPRAPVSRPAQSSTAWKCNGLRASHTRTSNQFTNSRIKSTQCRQNQIQVWSSDLEPHSDVLRISVWVAWPPLSCLQHFSTLSNTVLPLLPSSWYFCLSACHPILPAYISCRKKRQQIAIGWWLPSSVYCCSVPGSVLFCSWDGKQHRRTASHFPCSAAVSFRESRDLAVFSLLVSLLASSLGLPPTSLLFLCCSLIRSSPWDSRYKSYSTLLLPPNLWTRIHRGVAGP